MKYYSAGWQLVEEHVDDAGDTTRYALTDHQFSVVALMDGALFFVADLLRHLEMPVRLYTLSASSYHGGTASSGCCDTLNEGFSIDHSASASL